LSGPEQVFRNPKRCIDVKMKLQLKFYGTRGATPICGPGFLKFGGNTTCLQLLIPEANRVFIIDAGTGIRDLGKDLVDMGPVKNSIDIFFTHFHWDHIQGFPFFAPAYDPDMSINITTLGKGRDINNLKDIFDTQMQRIYFPVQLDKMGATFGFQNYDQENKRLKNMDGYNIIVKAIRHNHPGGAYTYRFEMEGKSFVFCTDIEHVNGIDQNIVDFTKGTDLLIHDAQYTAEELKDKGGWGHSSYDQAIRVAELAGVGQLVVTHHDPDHDDAFLCKMEHLCRKRFADMVFAREKMEIDW
jgi:phosphoribosyl 1,2-cyclic phosphodiesterase